MFDIEFCEVLEYYDACNYQHDLKGSHPLNGTARDDQQIRINNSFFLMRTFHFNEYLIDTLDMCLVPILTRCEGE